MLQGLGAEVLKTTQQLISPPLFVERAVLWQTCQRRKQSQMYLVRPLIWSSGSQLTQFQMMLEKKVQTNP